MRNKQKILRWLYRYDHIKLFRIAALRYELISYLVFGVLATLVNVSIYTFLEHVLGQSKWYLSNFPAIVIAILFAYMTNRSFVFDSTGGFWFEMLKFFSARIVVSLLFEYGAIYLMYNILHFDAELNLIYFSVSWFKIVSLIFVLTANYIASRLFVFRSNENDKAVK
jgi:putative flippase GtrA